MSQSLPTVNQDPENLLRSVRVFALDMDGTVYLGERWIDGAREFLRRIAETGRRFVFLTNNSSKGPENYLDKLAGMGFPITGDQIVTSGQATIWYLQQHFPGKRIFLLGNELLQREFLDAGILLDSRNPEVAVAAFDTSLTYDKLCRFCDLVRSGAPFLATHPDFNCPTETGFIPDTGSFLELIHASAFRYPDRVIGKPNRDISDYLMARLAQSGLPGLRRDEIAMVGDRLYTDIAAGVNAGFRSILVLSGEATLEDAAKSEVRPDLIFSSVAQIPLSQVPRSYCPESAAEEGPLRSKA